MNSIEQDPMIFIHLDPEESILTSLETIAKKHQITTAIIVSGIGQIKNPTIGYFKEKNDYLEETFKGIYELLTLSGNIIFTNNSYYTHAHVIFGDENKHTYGGHLIKGYVSITNEIVLLTSPIKLNRMIFSTTGLMHLHLPKKT
jgi:predicted DNA-binding protein with PD1-like motif